MILILLSLLMFFLFFTMGSFSPVISLYLTRSLGFSGNQAGLILSLSQIGLVFSPILVSRIADRIITPRKLLIIFFLSAAGLLLILGSRTGFISVLVVFFLLNMVTGPSTGLMNSVTFKRIKDPSVFGNIRVWGTIGWMAAGWANGLAVQIFPRVDNSTSLMFVLAAASAVIAAALTWFLPPVPPRPRSPETPIDTGALSSADSGDSPAGTSFKDSQDFRVLLKPGVRVAVFSYLLAGFLDRFYVFGSGLHLSAMAIPESLLMPLLSLGQATEIVMLLVLRPVLRRWSFRPTVLAGAFLLICRYAALLASSALPGMALPMAIIGIGMNGLVFSFFYTSVTIYIDDSVDDAQRSAVHQYLAVLFFGVAGFTGNSAAGFVFNGLAGSGLTSFIAYWAVPGVMAILVLLYLVLRFRPESRRISGA